MTLEVIFYCKSLVMKNKFLKGAHLSEKEVRELIHYFCEDVSASEIAQNSKISRITVNAYFKLFRTRILEFLMDELTEQDAYNDPNLLLTNVYGVKVVDGNVITQPIYLSEDIVNAMKRLRKIEISNFLLDQKVCEFQAIIDFKSIRIFKMKASQDYHLIENYWSDMKVRLVKSRGINRKTLLLHVKEIELRQRFKGQNFHYFLTQLLTQNKKVVSLKSSFKLPALESIAI